MSGTGRRKWWAVAVWGAAQLVVTSVPGSAVSVSAGHPWDWCIHAGMYGMLALLVVRAAREAGWPVRRLMWVGVALTVAAALDELHQLFIPGRDAAVDDWFFDTVGGALGLLIGSWLMGSKAARWLR